MRPPKWRDRTRNRVSRSPDQASQRGLLDVRGVPGVTVCESCRSRAAGDTGDKGDVSTLFSENVTASFHANSWNIPVIPDLGNLPTGDALGVWLARKLLSRDDATTEFAKRVSQVARTRDFAGRGFGECLDGLP